MAVKRAFTGVPLAYLDLIGWNLRGTYICQYVNIRLVIMFLGEINFGNHLNGLALIGQDDNHMIMGIFLHQFILFKLDMSAKSGS